MTVDELETILKANNQTIIITASEPSERDVARCWEMYFNLVLLSMFDNRSVQPVVALCPSSACSYLNATPLVSFRFYSKGVFLGKLDDGLDFLDYWTKPREFFGNATKQLT